MEPVSVRALQHGKTPVPAPLTRRLMGKFGVAALIGGLAMPGDSPKQEATYSHDPVAHSSQPHVQHAWEEIKSGRKMVFYSYRYRLFYYGYAKKGHWGMGQGYADVGKITIATTLLIRGKLYQKGQEWEIPEHLDAWQRENIPHALEGNGIIANIETAHAELARMLHDDSLVFVGFAHPQSKEDGENTPGNRHAKADQDSLGYLDSLAAGYGHNPFWWLSHFTPSHGSNSNETHASAQPTNHSHHDWYDGEDMTWLGYWSAVHHPPHAHDPHAGHEYHAGGDHDPWGHIGSLGIGHGHNPFWWLSHFTLGHTSSHHESDHAPSGHAHASHTHHHWYDGGDTTWLGYWHAVHHPPHAEEIDAEHEYHAGSTHNPWGYLGHMLDGSDHNPLAWHGMFGLMHAHHPRLVEEHVEHLVFDLHGHESVAHAPHAHETARGKGSKTHDAAHAESAHDSHVELANHGEKSVVLHEGLMQLQAPLSVIMGSPENEMTYAKVISAAASPENPKG